MKAPSPRSDDGYRSELLGMIQERIDQHPRSAQVEHGPSEVGACPRRLAWELAYGKPQQRGGWAAAKGTVLHAWLDAEVFGPRDRFLSDLKLPQVVEGINGGTLDLYDRERQVVLDFKLPGDASVAKMRSGNIPYAYWTQINLYGYGAKSAGLTVREVGLLVLPMCGDSLHGQSRGAILHLWDYDEQVALDSIAAYKRIQNLLIVGDPQRVMAMLETREDFCHGRPCYAPNGDPRAICPGSSRKDAVVQPLSKNPFA